MIVKGKVTPPKCLFYCCHSNNIIVINTRPLLTHKLQLSVAILSDYTYCLYWPMSTGLLFQNAYTEHVNSLLLKWCHWCAPTCQWKTWHWSHCQLTCICLGLVVEHWPIVGTYGHHSYSTFPFCVFLLLCFSL